MYGPASDGLSYKVGFGVEGSLQCGRTKKLYGSDWGGVQEEAHVKIKRWQGRMRIYPIDNSAWKRGRVLTMEADSDGEKHYVGRRMEEIFLFSG